MSLITWITPRGNLGTVPENIFYSYQLEAVDSSDQTLFYSFISGNLPGGMYVTREGELRGIPTVLSSVNQSLTNVFTIRATNPQGEVADRSFNLTVSNINGPQILPKPDYIGAWFDGNFLDYTFSVINDNPDAVHTWKIINGTIPPGTTFTSQGRLLGYVDIIAQNVSELGYEATPVDFGIYDPLPLSTDRYYNFTIQASDGLKNATYNVRLLIVSKGNFSADNDITLINNTFIGIDADNTYRPIILNNQVTLPTAISGNTFAYKFIAYDPEDEDVSWRIDELAFSGMDELDAAPEQTFAGNGTVGPYTMDLTPANAARVVVQVNGVLLEAVTDYSTLGDQLTFVNPILSTDTVYLQFILANKGFDSLLFDQGASGLPSGLTIDTSTGWVIGLLPPQTESIVTYSFIVQAYRTSNANLVSDPVTFFLNVRAEINDEIVWTTPMDLGFIDNGAVSELEVSAYHTLGKELVYSVVYAPFRKLPQGLKFLSSGRLIGRTTFRYFSLDGQEATLNITSTTDLTVGMTVQGVGVAQGCKITEIIDSNTIKVRPAIYVTQGSILVFTSDIIQKAVSTTTNAITTVIDGGRTTFDQDCGFTVRATAIDGSITSLKSFALSVRPRNLAPYENVYLKALPSYSQRLSWETIRKDETIFPPELIYRPDDSYFGVQANFKTLFLSGLAASTASTFVNALNRNHYNKKINFGEIKTARAVGPDGVVDYELIYVDLIDDQSYGTSGPPLEVQLTIANSFLINNQSFNVIYPNSFPNMQKRLESNIGYTNRSTLPRWMTSVQEDGTVLGLIRCVILAYTKPGASKLIAYRLGQSNFDINVIPFIADRYQWDNYLSRFYNPETNTFDPSLPTTFDKYPGVAQGSALFDTNLINNVNDSNVITISNTIEVGYGWKISSRTANLVIPEITTITALNVTGNTLTISSNITAFAGQTVRFDGDASVDYAISTAFNLIDGENLSYVRSSFYIDGVQNFNQGDKLVFAKQFGYGGENDGWIDSNGNGIPGYLSKVTGTSTVNQQGGVWELTWEEFPESGFDDDIVGFDEVSDELSFSHFDQGGDAEINLNFLQEIILNQSVKVKTGDTYKITTLQYQVVSGDIIPSYSVFRDPTGIFRTAETTFDGGTCIMREGFIAGNSVTGGTTFSNNKDIWIIPETLDKYIRFPQTGVFV